MIKLPISELLTPTDPATATAVRAGRADMPTAASFLKIMADIPVSNEVDERQTGVDAPEQLFEGDFPTQVLGGKVDVPNTGVLFVQMEVALQAGFDSLEGSRDKLPDPVGDSEMDSGGVLAAVSTLNEFSVLKGENVAGVSGSQAEIRVYSDAIPRTVPTGAKEARNGSFAMSVSTASKPENITDENDVPLIVTADPARKKTLNSVDNETLPPEFAKVHVRVISGKPSLSTQENRIGPPVAKKHDRKDHGSVSDLGNTQETMISDLVESKPRRSNTIPPPKQSITRLDVPNFPGKLELQPKKDQSNAVVSDKIKAPPQGALTPETASKPRRQTAVPGSSQAVETMPPQRTIANRPLAAYSTISPPHVRPAPSANPSAMEVVDVSMSSGKPAEVGSRPLRHRDTPLVQIPDPPTTANNPTVQPATASPFEFKNAVMTKDVVINTEVSESLEPFDLHMIETRHIESTSLRNNPTISRPEIPRHVARQLAEVVRQMPDRPVELTLNPDELGRVRLTFALTDGGINVAVLAERSETMDLLRRHIETLAREFRDLGYSDVGFQFSQNGHANTDGGDRAEDQRQTSNASLSEPTNPTRPAKLSLEPSTGLDLRL